MQRLHKAFLVSAVLIASTAAFGQQEKGNMEVGLAGSVSISNNSPVAGSILTQASLGDYVTRNQYLGGVINAAYVFGGGKGTTGTFGYALEYRYMFGAAGAKLQPFVGGQFGGQTTHVSRSTGNNGVVTPEFGIKYFASKKSSFEVVYQLPIGFAGVTNGETFGQRSSNQILFGFKHLF